MTNINLKLKEIKLVHFADFERFSRKNVDNMIESSKKEKSCYSCVSAGKESVCNCIILGEKEDKIPHQYREGWLNLMIAKEKVKKATEKIIKDLVDVSFPCESSSENKEIGLNKPQVNSVEIIS